MEFEFFIHLELKWASDLGVCRTECDKQFSSKTALLTHHKSVHMGQKFQCPQCDQQTARKDSLVIHQKSVYIGQKYQCPECEHQSSHKSNLYKHHKSVHMGQSVIITQLRKEAL